MTEDICIFMADFSGGGAERVMVNVANALSVRGHNVDMVVARESGKYRDLVRREIPVTALSRRLSSSLLPLFMRLRKTHPSCILAAGEHACEIAVLARAMSRSRARLVLSLHSAIQLPDPSISRVLQHRVRQRLLASFYSHADKVVTASNGLRKDAIQILRLEPTKVVAIYNPLFDSKLEALAKQPVAHRWLRQGENPLPVVIAVGRLTHVKGFDILIHAFAMVRKSVDARLIILGEGPNLDALRALSASLEVDEYVDFPGFVANPYTYIARSDVLAMSSRSEGFGNVLVEALAVGTPVVSTDCHCGPREILEGGHYGQLVLPEDPSALADGIITTLGDPTNAGLLKERASFFSIDTAVDQYEAAMGLRGE